MSVIKISNVSFGYIQSIQILKNINLEINEGDFLAIIGENGSGKSSLIKCILGLNASCNLILAGDTAGFDANWNSQNAF